MKKKIVLIMICSLLCINLCACDANDVNSVINGAGQKLQEVEIKQEDIDKASEAVGALTNTMKEIIEDEDVQEALKSGADVMKDIVSDPESAE